MFTTWSLSQRWLAKAAIILVALITALGITLYATTHHTAHANSLAPHTSSQTFQNPVLGQGQDPSVIYDGGAYYFTQSTPNTTAITIRTSSSLLSLGAAPQTTVYTAGEGGGPTNEIWAPELHHVNGGWYIYFTGITATASHFLYVLAASNALGPYTFSGKIAVATDVWAIDGTVFQNTDSQLYLLWSGFTSRADNTQNIFIAHMSTPTTLATDRVMISSPIYGWEQMGSPPKVNEGPAVLQHNGQIFVTYSASGCWTPDYKLGMLTASSGSNLLDPNSWSKSANPVFQRDDANGVYGPGGNQFFTSPDGTENWLVYHAITDANGNCATERTVRAQKINWNANGTPNFGVPASLNTPLGLPSGDPGTNQGSLAGRYKIKNNNSGLLMAVNNMSQSDGAQITQWNDNGTADHLWTLVDAGNGYYKIVNYNSGKVATPAGWSTANGANIIQWSDNGTADHLWKFINNGNGYYRIVNANSNKAATPAGWSTAAGTSIIQWDDNGTADHLWQLIPA